MTFPLVRDLGADGISVMVTYKWRGSAVTQRDWGNAHLINAAHDIHAYDPAFGYRFIANELPSRRIIADENCGARLCSQERICRCSRRGIRR